MDIESIKSQREELGLSVREMAKLADMDYSHLWRIEKGQVNAKRKTLLKIQAALDAYVRRQQKQQNANTNMIERVSEPSSPQYESDKTNLKAIIIARVIEVLDQAGESQEKVAASILSFTDGIEMSLLASYPSDAQMLGLAIEAYYSYLKEKNQG
jgi:transcriptional regulator with XRE-family HTH domain